MIQGDDKWYQVCAAILAGARAGLTTDVNRALITTGQVAWDDCCEGQLAVTFTRSSPSENFPAEVMTNTPTLAGSCSPAYEIGEISIQIVRCAPQPLNGQNAPSSGALSDAALQTMVDANQVKRLVTSTLCALKADVTQRFDYMIRDQLMLGPEGGCSGSELRVYTGLAVG